MSAEGKFMSMMMRNVLAALPFVALALLTSGCFPMRYSARTGTQGTVVDARTGAPLAGAEVFFSGMPFSFDVSTNENVSGAQYLVPGMPPGRPPSLEAAFSRAMGPIVFTDGEGRFIIAPVMKWGIYFVGEDFFGMASGGTLVVLKDGYKPELRDVNGVWPGDIKTAEINVPMKKLP